MLSVSAASAAELLHLSIFVFHLDLFVENIVIRNEIIFVIVTTHLKLKITIIASASLYNLITFPYAEKLNFSILRKNRLIGPR